VLLSCGAPSDGKNLFHARIEQAFAQDALAHHARRAKENHFHVKPAFSMRFEPAQIHWMI
jgi:hypothetical protein